MPVLGGHQQHGHRQGNTTGYQRGPGKKAQKVLHDDVTGFKSKLAGLS